MSGYKVNPKQVRMAYLHGLTPALIAKRLGITERHTRRLLEEVRSPQLETLDPQPLIGTDLEYIVWLGYKKNEGYSYRQLARIFCLSHEHIRQTLTQKITQAA